MTDKVIYQVSQRYGTARKGMCGSRKVGILKTLLLVIKVFYKGTNGPPCVFMLCLLFVPCSRVVTCLEITDLLALMCVVFPSVFVTFLYDVRG